MANFGLLGRLFNPGGFGLFNQDQPMPLQPGPGRPPSSMTMGYAPSPQGQQGGIFDWLGQHQNALFALSAGLSGAPSWAEGISDSAKYMPAAAAADRTTAETKRKNAAITAYIKANGKMDPAAQELLMNDPALAETWAANTLTPPKPDTTDLITNYTYAKQNGFTGSFLEYAAAQKASTGDKSKTSLVPTWGEDAQGNPVLMQMSDTGEAVPTKLPEGVRPSKGTTQIDLGTQFAILDRQTGQVIGYQPKDLTGAAAATAQGTVQGTAKGNLPLVKWAGESMIRSIDDVINDPNVKNVIGPIAGAIPQVSAAGNEARSRVDQILGKTFLQAYNDLRGGGSITESEGARATAAYTRLQNTRMGYDDWIKTVHELRDEIVRLQDVARQRAGEPVAVPAPTAAPVDLGNGITIQELP